MNFLSVQDRTRGDKVLVFKEVTVPAVLCEQDAIKNEQDTTLLYM